MPVTQTQKRPVQVHRAQRVLSCKNRRSSMPSCPPTRAAHARAFIVTPIWHRCNTTGGLRYALPYRVFARICKSSARHEKHCLPLALDELVKRPNLTADRHHLTTVSRSSFHGCRVSVDAVLLKPQPRSAGRLRCPRTDKPSVAGLLRYLRPETALVRLELVHHHRKLRGMGGRTGRLAILTFRRGTECR